MARRYLERSLILNCDIFPAQLRRGLVGLTLRAAHAEDSCCHSP